MRAGGGFVGGGGGAGLALSVATVAAASSDHGGFGNMQAAACGDLDTATGGEFVPAAELGQRDTESVGDGDQSIAAAGGVVYGVR